MSRNQVFGELLVNKTQVHFRVREQGHPNIPNNYDYLVPTVQIVYIINKEGMPIISGMNAYAEINWWKKDDPRNVTGAGFIESIRLSRNQDCDIIRYAYQLCPVNEERLIAINPKYNFKIVV